MNNPFSKLAAALSGREDEQDAERKPREPWYSHRMVAPTQRQLRRQRMRDQDRQRRKNRDALRRQRREQRRAGALLQVQILRAEEAARGLKPGELQQALIDAELLQGTMHRPAEILEKIEPAVERGVIADADDVAVNLKGVSL